MIEKVWAIKSREEKTASNGNKYLQVTIAGDDGKDHKQNFYEQGMWAVFKDNDYVKVELDKPEGESRWKVMSAVSAKDAMPQEGGSVEMLPQHEAEVREALGVIPAQSAEKVIPPQAVGMTTKEVGDMIRAKFIKTIFGDKIGCELIRWYRIQILGNSRLIHDPKDLPDLEAH